MKYWVRAVLASAVVLCALFALAYVALGSQAALDYVVRRAVQDADGHLTVEGAQGSLLSTVRVARIVWQGDDLDVEASDTAVAWSPLDLLSRKLIVQGLGAKRLSLHFKAQGRGGGLPATLALPLEVEVRNIGVERLDWRTPQQAGFVTGITFGYAGGAREHTIDKLRFVTDRGTLAGKATLGATPPYALTAALAFDGDGEFAGAKADLRVAGELENIAIDANGTLRSASIALKARVTPFAPAIVTSADIDARNVDLAQFADSLPTTSLTVTLTARPEGEGFTGTIDARNDTPGALDAGRIPVARAQSRFAWDGKTLALTNLDATLAGEGRARGNVSVFADGGQVKLDLALADIDLARLQSSLLRTRLSGTLAGEVDKTRQVLRGDLRQADLALAFNAIFEGRRMTLERARAQAGRGTLTGSGTLAFDSPRAFSVTAVASRFNPARFVNMPEAELDGKANAKGTLLPRYAISVDVDVAKGSKLAGLDVSGVARGDLTPSSARNVDADIALGGAKLTLKGSYGTPSDTLAFSTDIPRLSTLRPLAVRYAKAAVPDPLSGSLRARGTITGEAQTAGVSLDAHAEGLEWGPMLRAAALDVTGTLAPGRSAGAMTAFSERTLDVTVNGKGLAVPQGSLSSLKAHAAGTLAQHKLTIAATGEDVDVAASGHGGVGEFRRPSGAMETAWSGTLDAFANRGPYAVTLQSPATLLVARDWLELGTATIVVADGNVHIVKLVLDEGRITTQGTFTRVPVATAARVAGTKLPFASTLVVGGDWSLAATPRLSGTLNLYRESGDWFATESETLDPGDLALGISELVLALRFTEDAATATARFRSARAGNADARATLAAGRTPGRIDTNAPFTASITAELASLKPLQPWIGTLAVMDGRARIDVKGHGTLAQPNLDGTLAGDALRFDLPQYGVHLRDGVLRARLVERSIVLDEFSFAGGSGRFTAKGTLARASANNRLSGGRVEWQAQDFTIVNRPDLRLVGDGKGTLSLEGDKLALAGSVNIDEGRVDYERSRVGVLSEDVVIVGQPRRASERSMADLPLTLDLQVSLGSNFRFSGEGLDTKLAGNVHVTTTALGTLNSKGSIRAVQGTYYVFGQRLDIDRGRLLFDGPVDNPALDVVALRKNLAVEAGVEVTGTVKLPRVRLVSNPPVPDGEKLSWLLTGQGLDRASRNDLALLGAASASLIGQGKKPLTQQIANTVGLDDISVRETGASVTGGTSTQVVAFGKRISDRLSLVYEQGLTLASNALRIEYALSRTLTVRAEAGAVSSLGLYYRRTYD